MAPPEKEIQTWSHPEPGMPLQEKDLPTLRHTEDGFKVIETYVLKTGVVERADGKRLAYHDIRVYLDKKS